VLTYNLYLRPPLVNSNGNDYKNERLAEFIKLIPKYDVICLQEVFALGNSRYSTESGDTICCGVLESEMVNVKAGPADSGCSAREVPLDKIYRASYIYFKVC
jgi:hypothetical protein